MKNLFKVHILTYIALLIAFLTGYFKESIFFTMIILIHELGHLTLALFFKWKIVKIILLPFGGITIFNELINRPLIEEFLIAIMGPLFQIVFTIILNNSIVTYYSKIILLINLIPIYPLDGAKILNIIFNKLFFFRISYNLTLYLSYFLSIIFILLAVLKKELIFLLFIMILTIKLKKELSNRGLIFNKFLYERYLYKLKFRKVKIVKNEKKFKKDYYHFIDENKLIEEKDFLKQKFENLIND